MAKFAVQIALLVVFAMLNHDVGYKHGYCEAIAIYGEGP